MNCSNLTVSPAVAAALAENFGGQQSPLQVKAESKMAETA